jgi:hypothetical protein
MAKSHASSTTIPLAVIPNSMREMAFRKVDAVKRDADREARPASSSISTLPQGWSKENRLDLAQRRHAETWTGSGCPPLPRAPRRPEQLSKWPQERAVLKLVL